MATLARDPLYARRPSPPLAPVWSPGPNLLESTLAQAAGQSPFKPVFWTQARQVYSPQAVAPQNRLALISASLQAPFVPYDWPQPKRKAFTPQDTNVSGILIELLPMFRMWEWPQPNRLRYPRYVAPPQNLVPLYFIPTPEPFRPYPWPKLTKGELPRQLHPLPNLNTSTLAPPVVLNPVIPSFVLLQKPSRVLQWPTPQNLLGLYAGPPPEDTTPEAFAFTDQTDVALSTVITSDAVAVTGITAAASISIIGGTYSIDGGAFTSLDGTVDNGDFVRVRHTSSASYLTATDTVLTMGGVSDTFTSTTLAAPVVIPPITTPRHRTIFIHDRIHRR